MFFFNIDILTAASEDPEWILVEKDRFMNDYDRDADGRLDPQELLSWVVPNNQGIAQEEVSSTEWFSHPQICAIVVKEIQNLKPKKEVVELFRINAVLFLDLNLWSVLDRQRDKEVKMVLYMNSIVQ